MGEHAVKQFVALQVVSSKERAKVLIDDKEVRVMMLAPNPV